MVWSTSVPNFMLVDKCAQKIPKPPDYMSVLSVQGTPLDVINVSVTVVCFCFCFSVFRLLFAMFFPHYFYACQIDL